MLLLRTRLLRNGGRKEKERRRIGEGLHPNDKEDEGALHREDGRHSGRMAEHHVNIALRYHLRSPALCRALQFQIQHRSQREDKVLAVMTAVGEVEEEEEAGVEGGAVVVRGKAGELHPKMLSFRS